MLHTRTSLDLPLPFICVLPLIFVYPQSAVLLQEDGKAGRGLHIWSHSQPNQLLIMTPHISLAQLLVMTPHSHLAQLLVMTLHITYLDQLLYYRRMAELVVVSMFGLIVTEQYVSPAIVNSYGAFNELRYLQAFERLLKLSVPTLWGWLVVFYTLFHLLLNITAEFTGFGDREFYLVRLPL